MSTYKHPNSANILALANHNPQTVVSKSVLMNSLSGWTCLFDGRIRSMLRQHNSDLYSQMINGGGPLIFAMGALGSMCMASVFVAPLLALICGVLTIPIVLLFGGLLLSDAMKVLRDKWSDQIFMAQLDGLPIEALWKLIRCEDIKDCGESRSLIHKAIDRSNALSSKDVMAAYRVQTQDTTNPIHEIQNVAIEQASNVEQVTVETKTPWWNPVRRKVAQIHTQRTKL